MRFEDNIEIADALLMILKDSSPSRKSAKFLHKAIKNLTKATGVNEDG